jgi:hypothetical protein
LKALASHILGDAPFLANSIVKKGIRRGFSDIFVPIGGFQGADRGLESREKACGFMLSRRPGKKVSDKKKALAKAALRE